MLLHELDEDKNPARHYVLGNEYIGLDHNYYLTDEQGSVRYVLDAAGNVQNDYRYDAFGQRIAGHENILNRLRYNAQIEDDQTGLYYLRARYYNTGIGRFTQEDVIYNDGLNLYAYCSSNPVMYSDPSGYAKESIKQQSCGSKEGEKKSKALNEWLEDDPDLLKECNDWYNNNPEWWGIDPQKTPVFYRKKDEVAKIRKLAGERGGHHPHGLALGGPIGQKLTQTGETRKVKNPIHSRVTGLQKRVINKIKNK